MEVKLIYVRNSTVHSYVYVYFELVGCWRYLCDPVGDKSALGIVHQSEVLIGLLDLNDIHESSRICAVCPDLSVNFDMPLHEDGIDLPASQSIPALQQC